MSGSRLRRIAVPVARVFWLILPVITAGLGHVVVLKANALQRLAIPIDAAGSWRGRRVLGANKTWRGVLVMTVFSAGFTHLQAMIENRSHTSVLDVCRHYRLSPWIVGSSMGASYCLAELPNSFVKRRLGIAPGAGSPHAGPIQYLADQADSVLGCLLALRFLYPLRRGEAALAFVLGTGVHMGVDRLAHALGVKRRNG